MLLQGQAGYSSPDDVSEHLALDDLLDDHVRLDTGLCPLRPQASGTNQLRSPDN